MAKQRPSVKRLRRRRIARDKAIKETLRIEEEQQEYERRKNLPSGRDIIHKYCEGKMSGRPEYYSGRGAITSDLNSKLLEMVCRGVKAEYGDEAAANFVQFVYDHGKLSATAFLTDFYSFVSRECVHIPKEHKAIDEIGIGPDDDSREMNAMLGMMAFIGGGSDRDETEAIRYDFIFQHEGEYTPNPDMGRSMHGMYAY